MPTWEVNVNKTMVIIWHNITADLVVYSKKLDTGSWVELGVPTYIGDNIYEFNHIFTNTGMYAIKVTDNNNNKSKIEMLRILENELVEITKRTVIA